MSVIKISIVIPNYNQAHYIPIALDHALQQTSKAHEILVIDDGSTDNSVAIIQEYAAKYSQIKFLKNIQNMGVNYTLNRGLREASGTHVTFAAADDWMETNLLQAGMELLIKHPEAGLVSGSCWIVHEKTPHKSFAAKMPYPMKDCGYIDPYSARKLINKLDSWFAGNTVILNRLYALQESGYRPELQSFTDNFLCRVLASKYGCCFTPEKLATWRICDGGFAQSFNVNIEKQQQVIQAAVHLMQDNYADIFSISTINKVKQRFNFNLARTLWKSNNGKYSKDLSNFLDTTQNSIALKTMIKISLIISSSIPKINRELGSVLLFVLMRPFDIWQQLKMQIHNSG